MTTTYAFTREVLDRVLVETESAQMRLGCTEHPQSPVDAYYKDGRIRLLCSGCGFEAATVSVALASTGGDG